MAGPWFLEGLWIVLQMFFRIIEFGHKESVFFSIPEILIVNMARQGPCGLCTPIQLILVLVCLSPSRTQQNSIYLRALSCFHTNPIVE